jgi:hypothetical protein
MSDPYWNDDWREELKSDDYDAWERLCECRNTKRDMRKIAQLIYKYNRSKDKEECLDRAIEWITDWNNQCNLVPTQEEFDEMINSMN